MFTNGLSSSRDFSLAAAALAAATFAGLAAGTGTAQAGAMYGVQFLSSENTNVVNGTVYNGTALTATQVAGVVPQDNFNVVTSESTGGYNGPAVAGGPVTLADSTGSNSAGVQFSWVDLGNYFTSTAGWATPSANGNNGALLSAQSQSGYAASATSTAAVLPATYKFSNLAAGNYDLIAYTLNNSQLSSGAGYVGIVSVAVNGTSTGNTYYDQNQAQTVWLANQTFVRATSTTLTGATTMANYVEFSGLNVPSAGGYITLSNVAATGSTSSAVVNALQLVAVPEPATLGLFALGGLGLLLASRKRKARV